MIQLSTTPAVTMFRLEIKSLRMKIRTTLLKMRKLKDPQKKIKEDSNSSLNVKCNIESSGFMENLDESGVYFRTEAVDNVMTSTPLKLTRLKKIIVLHEVSNLKIYEDFDEIEDFNISAVTTYDESKERDTSDSDFVFNIYENIGGSLSVD